METSLKSVNWAKVYVFISSTFDDMHGERDYLVKRVFPRLSEWGEKRKLRIVDIDLRWGVTEADATFNKNVVNVCLNRIDECRPFFICFLGQRYGRILEPKDISEETFIKFPGLEKAVNERASLTELEVLHALISPFHSQQTINKNGYRPCECSFFYFRENSYLNEISQEPWYLKRIYSDEHETDIKKGEDLITKRKELEEKIKSTNQPCYIYKAQWSENERTPEIALPLKCPSTLKEIRKKWQKDWKDYANIDIVGLDVEKNTAVAIKAKEFNEKLTKGRLVDFESGGKELSDVILDDLKKAIEERFLDHKEITNQDDLQKEIDQQEQFVFINSEGFIKRPGHFDEFDEYVSSDSRRLFVLTGEAGIGKSTLLCNWMNHHKENIKSKSDHSIHFRFIGASDGSNTVYSLMRLFLREIKEINGKIEDDIPDDPVKLHNAFNDLLEKVGGIGQTVIVMDALNQLESGLSDISWVPRQLPKGIKLIVSFKRGEKEAEDLYTSLKADKDRVHLKELKPFEEREDREELISAYLDHYFKELDERYIGTLIDSPASHNPLFLKIVLSELRVFGEYANIGKKIKSDFGTTPLSAFEGVLTRLEQDPAYSPIDPPKAVPLIFNLLAHARSGLSADELGSMLIQDLKIANNEENRNHVLDTVYLFLRQVRFFLARRDGRYDFFYESFKKATLKKYVTDQKEKPLKRKSKNWHQILANYFEKQSLYLKGDEKKNPNLRKLSELPYQQNYGEQWKKLEKTLSDFHFLQTKVIAGMLHDVLNDYQLVNQRLPEHESWHGDSNKERKHQTNQIFLFNIKELTNTLELRNTFREFSSAFNQEFYTFQHSPYITSQQLYNNLYARNGFNGRIGTILKKFKELNVYPNCVHWFCRLNTAPTTSTSRSLLRTFDAHKKPVTTLACSSDGKLIASGDIGGIINVWQCNDCTIKTSFFAHEGGVASLEWLSYKPNESRIISAGRDQYIRIWDWRKEEEILSWKAGIFRIRSVILLSDNKHVIICGDDRNLRVWHIEKKQEEFLLSGHHGRVFCIAIDQGGEIIISGSEDKTAKVWSLERQNPLRILRGHKDSVRCAAVAASENTAVTGSDDMTLKIWNLNRGREIRTITGHKNRITCVSIALKSSLIISGSDDTTLKIWDIESGLLKKTLIGHSGGINTLGMDPEEKFCVSGGEDSTVRIWEMTVEEKKIEEIWEHQNCINAICSTEDGSLIASASDDHTIKLWDGRDGSYQLTFRGHVAPVKCVAFLNKEQIISGSSDYMIKVWDVYTGKLLKILGKLELGIVPNILKSIILRSPKKNNLLTQSHLLTRLYKPSGGHTKAITCITLIGEDFAVSGGKDGTVRLWDIELSKEIRLYEGFKGTIEFVQINQNQTTIIAAGSSSEIIIWKKNTGEIEKRLIGHKSSITCLLLLKEDLLVSGSLDKTVRLWRLPSGNSLLLEGHLGRVACIAADAKSNMIASGSHDKILKIWNIEKGVLIKNLLGHQSPVISVSFDLTGRKLISCDLDGQIIMWDIKSGQQINNVYLDSPITSMVLISSDKICVGTQRGGLVLLELKK
ncbi:DUF4062 domain-containing protein [Acidobacteriota bacterium]